jgi:hypothetical protein
MYRRLVIEAVQRIRSQFQNGRVFGVKDSLAEQSQFADKHHWMDAPAEKWQPLTLEELKALFEKATKPFWVSGGWAIDLFLGRQTRPHSDLDISVSRSDQLYFQSFLSSWELQVADGGLRSWKSGEKLISPAYNIWGRRVVEGSWNLQIMLCDLSDTEWIYRRNNAIRGPISELAWTDKGGLKVLSPTIQLLYKSRNPREKDELDLQECLAAFSAKQRKQLKQYILNDSGPSHPWLEAL